MQMGLAKKKSGFSLHVCEFHSVEIMRLVGGSQQGKSLPSGFSVFLLAKIAGIESEVLAT